MKTGKRKEEKKPEKVLSSYDEENSRNQNSASRDNAGAEYKISALDSLVFLMHEGERQVARERKGGRSRPLRGADAETCGD